MALTTRIVSQEMGEKIDTYLKKAASTSWILDGKVIHHRKGVYSNLLGLPNDGFMLEAFIEARGTRISIHKICKLRSKPNTGRFAPGMFEIGKCGKLLAEKYLNRFFEYLDRVDINNVKERRYIITSEVIEEVESEIDQSIDPKRITETEINAYDRIEMIQSIKHTLKYYCEELVEGDCSVSYDEDVQIFGIEFITKELNIEVSLGDIVRQKWEMNERLAKAALTCVIDLYLDAYARKERKEHYIEQLLELAMPNLQKTAGQDQEKLEKLKKQLLEHIEIQDFLYDMGKEHSDAGFEKWNRDEFISQNFDFDSIKHITHYVDMLYTAYCNGFAKLNGDALFSGNGGILLPDIFYRNKG